MRKALVILALLAVSVFAYGQVFDADKIVPANWGEDLDDTTVAIVIKYVGPAASATVDINGGNLELHSGAEGAEAADNDDAAGTASDVEDVADLAHADCGVDGAIDLAANAACDTVGELVDIINNTRYWRAQIVAALRADALGTAGTNLIDPADADAKEVNGTTLLVDNSDVGYVTIAMTPFTYRGAYKQAGSWFTNDSGFLGVSADNATLLDPFAGYISVVTGFAYIYGDGDTDGGKMRFYEVDMAANTETLVYEYDLGADDTWAYVPPATLGGPLSFAAGQKLLVRMYTSGTMDADNDILLHGFMYKTDLRR